jgi:hypothetical protein
MKKQIRTSFVQGTGLMVLLGFAAILSGCADLKGIQKFAKAGYDSTAYEGFVTDYSESVRRQEEYAPDKGRMTEVQRNYEERKKQQARLLVLSRTTSAYMAALGALAADDLVSFDKEAKGFTDAMEKAKFLDSKEAAAANALVSLLGRAATDAYRQHELKQIITEANPPLQILLGSMQQIVGEAYLGSLKIEKGALDSAYKTRVVMPLTDENAGWLLPLRATYFSRLHRLEEQQQAAESYAESIGLIAKAHQKLFDDQDKVSFTELSNTAESYAKEAKALYDAAKDLLKKE